MTYTGLALTPCTGTVTGAHLNLDMTSSLIYANNTDAGMTASASYTYPGDSNHIGSNQTVNFTINKANQAALLITPPVGPVPSGTAGVTLTASGGTTGNTVVWTLLTTSTASKCVVASATALTGTLSDVGGTSIDSGKTCVVQATMPGNSNYNDVSTSVTITLT